MTDDTLVKNGIGIDHLSLQVFMDETLVGAAPKSEPAPKPEGDPNKFLVGKCRDKVRI